jgi:hypothetical protein
MGGLCITHEMIVNAYKILVRNLKEKRILGRQRRTLRWDDNTRIILNKWGLSAWVLSDLYDSICMYV